jgi:hypothetical protein
MGSTSKPDFADLSKEEQEFVKEKKVAGNKTIGEWLTFFTPLALFDKKGDVTRRNGDYIRAFWVFWIVFGVYMAFIYMNAGVPPTDLIMAVGIILGSALLLIITNKFFEKIDSGDLPNLLRGFVVPYLEEMQSRFGAKIDISLNLDLSKIDELEEETAELDKTETMNYLISSFKLPDSGLVELKVDAMGTKRPYYSRYKLVHSLDLTLSFDTTIFRRSGNEDSFEISEKDNKIIVQDKYEEQSQSPIESDPGPHIDDFSDRLSAMSRAVEPISPA